MSGGIKTFLIKYEPVNEKNTFSSGDTIQGRVILEVSKEVKIEKLYIKCKGDGNVHWTESNSSNNAEDSYSAHERYFKLKQILIWDNSKIGQNGATLVTNGKTYNNLVLPGLHAYPFSFQLPYGNTPSSFKGCYGSIKYVLQARLSRSWKIPQSASQEFIFVSRDHENALDHLMRPLSGTVEKKMKLFTSGSASVRASTDKKGYMQGERIKVETHVENFSSRALKLKFKFVQDQTFYAQSKSHHSTKVIFKAVEDPIPSRAKKTFTSRLKIPSNLDLTLTNCNIIKVEYTLKVYLDVPYATDPEIIFPLVIIPAGQLFIPQQSQVDSHANQRACSNQHLFQPALVHLPNLPAATAFGPVPALYPGVYTQSANPEEPPPSYTDIFPESNASASGFNPSLLPFSPPPYTTLDSSHAAQHYTPEHPSTSDYWQSPASPESYPTK